MKRWLVLLVSADFGPMGFHHRQELSAQLSRTDSLVGPAPDELVVAQLRRFGSCAQQAFAA